MPLIANSKYYYIKANGKYYDIYNPFRTFTLTINPTPSDATVTLTATGYTQVGNSITVKRGTTVSWSVSKSGYTTQSGSQTMNTDETKSVTLSPSLLFKCYVTTSSGYTFYFYVSNSNELYCCSQLTTRATSSSDLVKMTSGESITSISETTLVVDLGEPYHITYTCTRNTDYDLYT